MKMQYNSRRAKRQNRKKARLERSFAKGTNAPKRKNKGVKGFNKYFYFVDGNTLTKKGLKKKYRGKVYR